MKRVKRVKDATRIAKLSLEQLGDLYQKVIDRQYVNTHDLPIEFESYYCHESARCRNPKGYTGGIKLYRNTGKRSEYDYPVDGEPKSNIEFCATQVVLAYHGMFAETPDATASHLCDNTSCNRLEHLVWESMQDNMDRKNCRGEVWCTCGCGHLLNVCGHLPRCKIGKYKFEV